MPSPTEPTSHPPSPSPEAALEAAIAPMLSKPPAPSREARLRPWDTINTPEARREALLARIGTGIGASPEERALRPLLLAVQRRKEIGGLA